MDLEDRILYLEDRHRRLDQSTSKLEGELKGDFDSAKEQKLKELKKLKLSVKDELEDLRSVSKQFASSPEEQRIYNLRQTD
jgi:hypothetical protein